MIPHDLVTEWRREAPWVQDSQVEQDLVISRAVAEIFADAELGRTLAFRGGTALHKLRLRPAVRFSADIGPLLRPGTAWDPDIAFDAVASLLIARLPGDPWRGRPGRA